MKLFAFEIAGELVEIIEMSSMDEPEELKQLRDRIVAIRNYETAKHWVEFMDGLFDYAGLRLHGRKLEELRELRSRMHRGLASFDKFYESSLALLTRLYQCSAGVFMNVSDINADDWSEYTNKLSSIEVALASIPNHTEKPGLRAWAQEQLLERFTFLESIAQEKQASKILARLDEVRPEFDVLLICEILESSE